MKMNEKKRGQTGKVCLLFSQAGNASLQYMDQDERSEKVFKYCPASHQHKQTDPEVSAAPDMKRGIRFGFLFIF